MPCRKKVNSLKSMCIDNICENMQSFWYENKWKDIYCSPERLMSEDGPFEYMPDCLVNEIAEKLNKKLRFRDYVFSAVITSTLAKFTVPQYFEMRSKTFDLMTLKCQDSLKELTLSRCIFKNRFFIKAIKSLQKLEVLNLDGTKINNEVLAVVGSHCSGLRKLDVSDNRYFTDESMEFLFVNKSTGDGVITSYGKCKLLESLNIGRTNISLNGIETVLENAPKLQKLDHPNVFFALDIMHSIALEANFPPPQYSLTSLKAEYNTGIDPQSSFSHSLSIATQICPHLMDVSLSVKRKIIEKDVLHPLCQLNNLKNLDVRFVCCEQYNFFFAEVVPVLSVSGQSIKRLHLVAIASADVGIIGVCCPLLEDFYLRIDGDYAVPQPREEMSIPPASNERPFAFLRFLNVSDSGRREDCDMTPSEWKDMLSSRHLESIAISKSSSLTQGVLYEVLKADQEFPNLRKLHLFKCPNVTVVFVQTFLNLQNPLEEIKVVGCKKINKSDFDSLKSFCQVNAFDVVMEFEEWVNESWESEGESSSFSDDGESSEDDRESLEDDEESSKDDDESSEDDDDEYFYGGGFS